MSLYNHYFLRTGAQQRASIGFRDQTTLHMNQRTDALLRSPHITYVSRGEVDELLAPGSDHRVQTAAAVATAIGTNFDIRVRGKQTTVIVVHGAVQVKNGRGKVLVKTNHETTVSPNRPPSKPQSVDATAATAWTNNIPAPQLGENLALDASGGKILAVTSQRPGGEATRANDGQLDTAWESAPGVTTNASLTLGFEGTKFFQVTGILIDGAAAKGRSSGTDLKDFAIRYSSTGKDDRDFGTLLTGTLQRTNRLQWFPLNHAIRYLQLVAKSNYGSKDGISVAEIEVVGVPNTGHVFDFPEGIAVNPQGNIDVVDGGFGFVQRLSPSGKLLATLGDPGTDTGHLQASGGLAEDGSGNIYVMNFGQRLVKLSPSGAVLGEWGSAGSGQGQFAAATGVAVDTQGNVYVADSNNGRVEKFSSTGQFLAEFHGSPKRLGGILGIAVDAQGNMYVSDGAGDVVVKLSPAGQELTRWGTPGRGPGQFSHPVGIALDIQGNVYVADAQNNRVEKFTSSGQYLASFSTPGPTPSTPLRPEFVAVDAQNNVYVTTGTHGQVVQKISPSGQLLATWR